MKVSPTRIKLTSSGSTAFCDKISLTTSRHSFFFKLSMFNTAYLSLAWRTLTSIVMLTMDHPSLGC
jgi:hypothetical protein